MFAFIVYLVLIAGCPFVYVWPDAVRWNAQAVMLVEIALRILILSFIGVLLQIKDQPRAVALFMYGVQLSLLVLLALRLAFPSAQWFDQSSILNSVLYLWGLLAILAALYTGTRQKLPYNWFSYFVPLFLVLESIILLLLFLGVSIIKPLQ